MRGVYALDDLQDKWLGQWSADIFSLFAYPPRWRERFGETPNDTTRLILEFKQGDRDAIATVIEWTLAAPNFSAVTLQNLGVRYAVAAPRSAAARPNAGCEAVAAALSASFPFIQHVPGALERHRSVAASHLGGSHPADDHVRSVRYVGPALEDGAAAGSSILLIDDVMTEGNTFRGCAQILLDASGCKGVLGLIVGKTERSHDAPKAVLA